MGKMKKAAYQKVIDCVLSYSIDYKNKQKNLVLDPTVENSCIEFIEKHRNVTREHAYDYLLKRKIVATSKKRPDGQCPTWAPIGAGVFVLLGILNIFSFWTTGYNWFFLLLFIFCISLSKYCSIIIRDAKKALHAANEWHNINANYTEVLERMNTIFEK